MSYFQVARFLQNQQGTARPDTALVDSALRADTLTLGERIRADSTLYRLTDTPRLGDLAREITDYLFDLRLWIGFVGLVLQILLILFLAAFAIRIIDKITTRWISRFNDLPAVHPRRQRAYTLSNLLSSTSRYIVWPLAFIIILGELDINVGALIATAGIAGLAIGFGAQTLVKDVISGVFLLFDDTIHVGDLMRIGDESGVVEFIGLRVIKVRKFDGEVLMIPAGELRIFGNRSIGYARMIVNVGLSYEQDIETILPVMERVAGEWASRRKDILLEEKPVVQAITDFADSSIMSRIIVQVVPGEQWQAERELRVLLKHEFDKLGIEIPFPRNTVYLREESATPPRTIFDPAIASSEQTEEGSD